MSCERIIEWIGLFIISYDYRLRLCISFLFFFFNDPAPPKFSPLPLHAPLPIFTELGAPPPWHRLWGRAPHTLLEASGLAVGLPEGQMGNSEVGHLNRGAGRIVPQDIVRISQSIQWGEFFRLPPLVALCDQVRRQGGKLHLLSLIGTGGVHALDTHLLAGVELGARAGLPVAIHAWLDGRDTPPKSALAFMEELRRTVGQSDGRTVVSTVIGRYYAMDRDKRWDRTKLADDAMLYGSC